MYFGQANNAPVFINILMMRHNDALESLALCRQSIIHVQCECMSTVLYTVIFALKPQNIEELYTSTTQFWGA